MWNCLKAKCIIKPGLTVINHSHECPVVPNSDLTSVSPQSDVNNRLVPHPDSPVPAPHPDRKKTSTFMYSSIYLLINRVNVYIKGIL